VLLPECGHDRHHGFDKTGPVGTRGPKTAFAPQHNRCNGYSVTTGFTVGSAVTWCRYGGGSSPCKGW
jgi:hypothetical protein